MFLDGSTPLDSMPMALTPNTFTSATFVQVFGTPDTTLTTPTVFCPQAIAGDLNGEGIADLLLYNFASPQALSAQAFLGNGKGGYAADALPGIRW